MISFVLWLCVMPVIMILAGLIWLGMLRLVVVLFTGR